MNNTLLNPGLPLLLIVFQLVIFALFCWLLIEIIRWLRRH